MRGDLSRSSWRFSRINPHSPSGAEKTGHGVVCFISNYSWLDGLSLPGMREHYLEAFDAIRIDSLNGDSRETGKISPDD